MDNNDVAVWRMMHIFGDFPGKLTVTVYFTHRSPRDQQFAMDNPVFRIDPA